MLGESKLLKANASTSMSAEQLGGRFDTTMWLVEIKARVLKLGRGCYLQRHTNNQAGLMHEPFVPGNNRPHQALRNRVRLCGTFCPPVVYTFVFWILCTIYWLKVITTGVSATSVHAYGTTRPECCAHKGYSKLVSRRCNSLGYRIHVQHQ